MRDDHYAVLPEMMAGVAGVSLAARSLRRRCFVRGAHTMELSRTPRLDPCIPVIPNPTQLAAYRWLLRYLFADGDATPPPEPTPLAANTRVRGKAGSVTTRRKASGRLAATTQHDAPADYQ